MTFEAWWEKFVLDEEGECVGKPYTPFMLRDYFERAFAAGLEEAEALATKRSDGWNGAGHIAAYMIIEDIRARRAALAGKGKSDGT